MKVIFYCLAVLLGAQGLSACQSLITGRPSLQEAQWQLTDLNGQPLLLLAGEHQPMLHFERDGHIGGVAGCNQLRGDYQLRGRELRIAPVITTHELCPEAIMKREKELLRALEGGSSYVLAADTLSLRNPIGIALIQFRRIPKGTYIFRTPRVLTLGAGAASAANIFQRKYLFAAEAAPTKNIGAH